jgi:hypothetical protein
MACKENVPMTNSIISIGQAAALIQAMPTRIRNAAIALGIQPAMRINNVDHFAESDIERIAAYLRNQAASASDGVVSQRLNIH